MSRNRLTPLCGETARDGAKWREMARDRARSREMARDRARSLLVRRVVVRAREGCVREDDEVGGAFVLRSKGVALGLGVDRNLNN